MHYGIVFSVRQGPLGVGFGGTGRKRKGPCTKQCAWRKRGSSDTRLAEASPPKLRNTVKYRVEEMLFGTFPDIFPRFSEFFRIFPSGHFLRIKGL